MGMVSAVLLLMVKLLSCWVAATAVVVWSVAAAAAMRTSQIGKHQVRLRARVVRLRSERLVQGRLAGGAPARGGCLGGEDLRVGVVVR